MNLIGDITCTSFCVCKMLGNTLGWSATGVTVPGETFGLLSRAALDGGVVGGSGRMEVLTEVAITFNTWPRMLL